MLKKVVLPTQKKVTKKIATTPIVSTPNSLKVEKASGSDVERILVENFVSLQKVMVNLSIKMENLTSQISQLLNLFEISAKSLAEKGGNLGSSYEKRMMEKIDNIADQNKTIARGVTLLHEGEELPKNPVTPQQNQSPFPLKQYSGPPSQQTSEPINKERYQKSISSTPQQRFNKLPQG